MSIGTDTTQSTPVGVIIIIGVLEFVPHNSYRIIRRYHQDPCQDWVNKQPRKSLLDTTVVD